MTPTKFHFIWINKDGSSKIFDEVFNNINTFKNLHLNWDFYIWDTESCKILANSLPENIKKIYNSKKTTFVQKTDILRAAILLRHGGIYVDTDMICVKSFCQLVFEDFFIGEEKVEKESHQCKDFQVANDMHCITNAVIGCKKNHPILKKYFELLPQVENKVRTSYGPKLFERCIFECKKSRPVILEYDYFYPISYFENIKDLHLTANTRTIHLYTKTK